jgi:hypothetical protein
VSEKDHGESFYVAVAHALTGCQLVEQELKLYITQALDLARKCVGKRMAFKLSGDDFEESPMERLIGMFRKLSDNPALLADLEKFKRERNFLSHKGITYCLDYDRELSSGHVEDVQPRLVDIREEADRLVEAIHDEANKFRGYLYFEKLAEP